MNSMTRFYLTISGGALIIGIVLFALMHHWLIIRVPLLHGYQSYLPDQSSPTKKKIALHYYRDGWHQEMTDIIGHESIDQTLSHLITAWLAHAHEEKLLSKKCTLLTVLLNEKQTVAYLSFDQPLHSALSTTFEQWMLIESMLKTITENGIRLQSIQFLVNHKPMHDAHLDYSHAWPVSGFCQ